MHQFKFGSSGDLTIAIGNDGGFVAAKHLGMGNVPGTIGAAAQLLAEK